MRRSFGVPVSAFAHFRGLYLMRVTLELTFGQIAVTSCEPCRDRDLWIGFLSVNEREYRDLRFTGSMPRRGGYQGV